MPRNLYVNQGGTWKQVTTPYVKQGGIWKPVQAGYIKQSGSWKLFYAPLTQQIYTAPGTYSFTVPFYATTLTVEVWGAGGGGGQSRYPAGGGGTGGTSSWAGTVIATGGTGGGSANASPGNGGLASGGDVNTNGNNGVTTTGGTAPSGSIPGGIGGIMYLNGDWGGQPGGGGGGAYSVLGSHGGGGGSGAYSKKTYAVGALTVGSTITVVVGLGGPGQPATANLGEYSGGTGGNGEVIITWNE